MQIIKNKMANKNLSLAIVDPILYFVNDHVNVINIIRVPVDKASFPKNCKVMGKVIIIIGKITLAKVGARV